MATINKELIELKEENEELRELLSEQSGKLERAIQAIHALHEGLYNVRTQNYCMLLANARLLGEELPPIEKEGTYHQWPTTRQGDYHEKRISSLEGLVKALEDKINILQERRA
jgi:hypothetical protein